MVFTVGDIIGSAGLAASLTLLLVLVGLPITWSTRRVVPSVPFSFGTCWLFGLGWISILSWYAFANGLSPTWAYRVALALGAGFVLLAMAYGVARFQKGRRAPKAFGDWSVDALVYLGCMLLFTLLCISNVRHGDLPWVTSGNNDLLSYLKMGSYLLHFPGDLQTSDTKNLHVFAYTDVFGAFNLVAFGSFITRMGVEHFAIPAMAGIVGIIGMAITRCCRKLFCLGAPLSFLIAAFTLTGPLFSYITLNYFLGQILLIAALSTTTLSMTEISRFAPLELRSSAALGLASSIVVMICYPPWFIQYVTIFSGAAAVLSMHRSGFTIPQWAMTVVARTFAGIVALVLILSVLTFARVDAALTRLAVVSQANVAGWPLSFVDLDLLLGLPVDWRMHDADVAVVGRSLAFIGLISLVFTMIQRFDRGCERFARSILVIAFAGSVVAYLAIWAWFGPSYQQWKFATTIPLAFGFVVPAAAVYVSIMGTSRRTSICIRSAVACAVVVVIALNLQQYRDRWSQDVYHFPASLSSAKLIDATPGAARGYIKADSYLARMGASVFVVYKPVTFSGPTYWGDAAPAPDDGPFVIVEAACRDGKQARTDYLAQIIQGGALPILPLDQPVFFGGGIDACVHVDGFSGAESDGRWTDGRHASIRVVCGCDLSRDAVALVIDASPFLIGGRFDHQMAIFRVNGAAPQRFDLTEAVDRRLNVKIEPAHFGDNTVDIEIELPDAASPTIVGGQDKRTLGLFVHDVELRKVDAPS